MLLLFMLVIVEVRVGSCGSNYKCRTSQPSDIINTKVNFLRRIYVAVLIGYWCLSGDLSYYTQDTHESRPLLCSFGCASHLWGMGMRQPSWLPELWQGSLCHVWPSHTSVAVLSLLAGGPGPLWMSSHQVTTAYTIIFKLNGQQHLPISLLATYPQSVLLAPCLKSISRGSRLLG